MDKDELAAASGTVQVYPREVQAVRHELQARGFVLLVEIARAIADAFLAAGRGKFVVTPRGQSVPRTPPSISGPESGLRRC